MLNPYFFVEGEGEPATELEVEDLRPQLGSVTRVHVVRENKELWVRACCIGDRTQSLGICRFNHTSLCKIGPHYYS